MSQTIFCVKMSSNVFVLCLVLLALTKGTAEARSMETAVRTIRSSVLHSNISRNIGNDIQRSTINSSPNIYNSRIYDSTINSSTIKNSYINTHSTITDSTVDGGSTITSSTTNSANIYNCIVIDSVINSATVRNQVIVNQVING